MTPKNTVLPARSARRLPVRRGVQAVHNVSSWLLVMLALLLAVAAGPLLFMEHQQRSVHLELGESIVVYPLPKSAAQPKEERRDDNPAGQEAGCVPAAGPVNIQQCAGKAAYADTWGSYWTDFSGPGWSKEWADD